MSLGLSIFLSSLLLGVVAIFIATKDRWNWKKIILWPFAGLILLATGFWLYNTIEQRPKVQAELWDIPLRATKSDVKFLKGAPSAPQNAGTEDNWEYRFENSGGGWNYIYRVMYEDGKVWSVQYLASSETAFGPGIQGIYVGDSLEKITQKFGSPSNVSSSKDELKRLFSFIKYQLAFELKEDRVISYGIFDATKSKGLSYATDKSAGEKE
jgi:hypothetical protein